MSLLLMYTVPQDHLYQHQPFAQTPKGHQGMLCILKHVQQGDPGVHQWDDKALLPHTSAMLKSKMDVSKHVLSHPIGIFDYKLCTVHLHILGKNVVFYPMLITLQ